MYTRSYSEVGVPLPEGYSGTAFREADETEITEAEVSDTPESERGSKEAAETGAGALGSLLGRGSLGGLFKGIGLHMPSLGTEELLILAAAAFLFFSDWGDKECALMLLFLLFV